MNYYITVLILVSISLSFSLFLRANNPKGLLEVREALEKVHKVEDLLPIMKVNLSSELCAVGVSRKKIKRTALSRKALIIVKFMFINTVL